MTPLSYSAYQRQALDGDVALWEPRDLVGRLIAYGTDGPYCHATLIAGFHGQLWSMGYQEHRDGFISPLQREVFKAPGKISIYRLEGLSIGERQMICDHMLDSLSGEYQWENIVLIAFAHTLTGKLLARSEWYRNLARKQALKTRGAICSQAVARAYRLGSGNRLSLKTESVTTPNDLAGAMQYVGTLTALDERHIADLKKRWNELSRGPRSAA